METRTEKQLKGLKFESFIMDWFSENKKINLSHYTTYDEQIHKGENRQGIEIKNDQMFKRTGNLFISVSRDYGYVEYCSGICKGQSWLYVIGDEEEFYIFSTKQLVQFYKEQTPKIFNGFTSPKNGTEKGFLLSKKQAESLCVEKITKQTKLF
tara:strand:- start:807 stop:1265 length:459 start_codon:yes stop_codon:yes gene_type:complete